MKLLIIATIFVLGGLGLIVYKVEKSDINFPYPAHMQYIYGSIVPNSDSQKDMDKIVSDYYDIWKKEFKFQPRPWYASLLNIKKNYKN